MLVVRTAKIIAAIVIMFIIIYFISILCISWYPSLRKSIDTLKTNVWKVSAFLRAGVVRRIQRDIGHHSVSPIPIR